LEFCAAGDEFSVDRAGAGLLALVVGVFIGLGEIIEGIRCAAGC